MLKINVISNYNNIMFFISEYLNSVVHIHVNEKLIFSDLKKKTVLNFKKDSVNALVNASSVLSNRINKKHNSILCREFSTFRLEYKVYNEVFDKKTYLGILLFFYCHFNSILKYNNNSYNNYISYCLNLNINDVFTLNATYFLFNSFMHEYYFDRFFSQDQPLKLFDIEFKTISLFPSNFYYFDIINFNSSVNICFLNKRSNNLLSKIILSHLYLNV
jgi:hypothetical protein